jgi:hypothetical protein
MIVTPGYYHARFDNPHTLSREWYRNRRLTAKVDLRVIEAAQKDKTLNNPFTDEALLPWESGSVTGDRRAIPEELL